MELLELVRVNYNTIETLQKSKKISGQKMEKYNTNYNSRINAAAKMVTFWITSLSCPDIEVDKDGSHKLTKILYNDFEDVIIGIGYFEGTFTLKIKEGSKLCKAQLRLVAYILQWLFRKQL